MKSEEFRIRRRGTLSATHTTALFGASAGAALGSFAGPVGVAVGSLLGVVVGAVAAAVLDEQEADIATHERQLLDEEAEAPNDSWPILLQRRLSSRHHHGQSG